MKKHLILTTGLFLTMSVVIAQNQLNWGTIDNEVSNATTGILSIIGHLAGAAISVGFLITLYNVITGKSESKEKLGYFIAGLALYIIALTLGWI